VTAGRSPTARVAAVTGGARGIGRACVRALAEAGYAVVIGDIDSAGAEDAATEIRDQGGQAVAYHCDVSLADQAAGFITHAVSAYGRLDCAVNNAGINDQAPAAADLSPELWEQIWSVNVHGVWLCMKAEIRHMLTRGGGAIVNMASTLSMVAAPNAAAYVASKHAVLGLTRAAALDYAQHDLRINAVCPGPVPTDMARKVLGGGPTAAEQLRNTIPTGRFTTPEEVAAAAVWLCSPSASHVVGHGLVVDGGLTIA
jgi:NAD(P)-dependent dehydrogenase (short-subunit alcohol dehydrogenase family)